MDETQPGVTKPVPRRTRRRLFIMLGALGVLVVSGYLFLFFGLNYFGEKLLRNYLREKVIKASDSIYQIDFASLHVNILTGRVRLDSLHLTPDTALYRELLLRGTTARSLYHLSLGSLVVDRVHYMQILAGRRINFRQLILDHPRISIVAYPDTTVQQHRRWRVIYDDIYPVVSTFFNDFHIDSVRVNRGVFLSSSLKSGHTSQADYEFSTLLKDVAVNPFSYYNRERVFYSRSVDLVVHNFEYYLADSLYRLSAEEIGFSLTRSHIFGKKIVLRPDLNPEKLRHFAGRELFSFELPGFSIDGLDLYQAMTTRQVHIDSVDIADLSVNVFQTHGVKRTKRTSSISEKRILSGIYDIVSKEIRELSIDTVAIQRASFRYFAGIEQKNPELSIGEVSLGMSDFLLDSLSGIDDNRILYARHIELLLTRFSLALKDDVHRAEAAMVRISTRHSSIDVYECTMLPQQGWQAAGTRPLVNLLDIRVPSLGFRGIDLRNMFNHRIIEFNTLTIGEPEVRFLRVRRTTNPDPRFGKPKDFFEQENEGVVYAMLKRYVNRITGDSIEINRGFARISALGGDQEVPVAAASFDLTMRQFTLDSIHGMNREGFFFSRDFSLDLWSVTMQLSSGNGMVEAGKVSLRSADSTITAHNLHVSTYGGASPLRTQKGSAKALSVDFTLDSLLLTGLDHRGLFLDQVVHATEIRLENPVLLVKAIRRPHAAGLFHGPTAEPAPVFFHAFDVKKCVIRHGTMNYDGEEDRRSSHFRLNDINFNLVNARVVLPGSGNTGGLIRFDSLQLHVLPFRAMLADSTYALEAGSLEIRSYPVNIRLRAVKVIPLDPTARNRYAFTIPEIRVKGFYFDRALFEKNWHIDSVAIDQPVAEIRTRTGKTTEKHAIHPADAPLFTLPLFMKELDVDRISLSDGHLLLSGGMTPGGREWALHGMKITVDDLHLDSAGTSCSPLALLNTSRVQFVAPGFPILLHDSLYTLTFSRFGFDSRSGEAFFDSVALKPLFSRDDMMGTSTFGADRMQWLSGRVDVKRIRMEKLLTDRVFHAGLVHFDGFSFGLFHDKRVAVPATRVHPMPQEAIRRITHPLVIDSVVVQDGYIEYEEQTGDVPGKIFFDRTGVVITGFSTHQEDQGNGNSNMVVTGKARLMGEGITSARFTFFPEHPSDSFTVAAQVTAFDLTRLNGLVPYLTPVMVNSGHLDSLSIIELNGNNRQATGQLNIRYHGATVNLFHDETRYRSRFERLILNEVINLLLPDDHPLPKKADRTGKILYIRDPHKGFFNFVWKSMLNGIVSDLGFEKAAQKNVLTSKPETTKR